MPTTAAQREQMHTAIQAARHALNDAQRAAQALTDATGRAAEAIGTLRPYASPLPAIEWAAPPVATWAAELDAMIPAIKAGANR